MSVKRYSVENERLVIEFNDEVRPVFIKGETINGVFHVRTEDFETYPDLSYSDREDIKVVLRGGTVVID